jgi:hypothetical protein
MAISTYDKLKSGIADFLNRDDLTDVIPTFIDMAQGQINRDVRHWKMETTAQLSTSGDYVYMPTGWLETKNVQYYPDIGDYNKFQPLEYLSQNALDERKINSENKIGDPQYYTLAALDGTPIMMLFPHPKALTNDRVNLSYLNSLDLGLSSTSNWLIEDYPDVYLYGSLIHAAIYLKDDERLALFSQMYGAAVQRVNASSDESEYKHDRLRTRKLGLDTSRSKQPNHVRWS